MPVGQRSAGCVLDAQSPGPRQAESIHSCGTAILKNRQSTTNNLLTDSLRAESRRDGGNVLASCSKTDLASQSRSDCRVVQPTLLEQREEWSMEPPQAVATARARLALLPGSHVNFVVRQ